MQSEGQETDYLLFEESQKGEYWDTCLRKIYGLPATVTIIKGEWKTGKTDFALHIVEELIRLDLISEAGSNIQCFKDPGCTIEDNSIVQYLDNFGDLKSWMYSGRRKAYLFDEAIKSAPSRKAMSSLNTGWLEIIPELSKGRMNLIVITQETEFTEKSFLHPTFIRAEWEKLTLPSNHPQYRKEVFLKSKLISWPYEHTFKNIPATKLIFDPFKSAVFRQAPDTSDMAKLSLDLRVAIDYANGLSTDDLVDKYEELSNRTMATRAIRKALKVLIEKYQVSKTKRWNEESSSQILEQKT